MDFFLDSAVGPIIDSRVGLGKGSHGIVQIIGVFTPPKWMVKIMENPY